MDAGQIGGIADLHGFAARRVQDKDVLYASSVQGWQSTVYGKPIEGLRLHVPVTGFLHPCWNDGVLPKMRIAVDLWRALPLGLV